MYWKSRSSCPTNSPALRPASRRWSSALGATRWATPGLRLIAAAHMGLAVMPAVGGALALVQLGRFLVSQLVGIVGRLAIAGCRRLFALGRLFASHGCVPCQVGRQSFFQTALPGRIKARVVEKTSSCHGRLLDQAGAAGVRQRRLCQPAQNNSWIALFSQLQVAVRTVGLGNPAATPRESGTVSPH